MPVRQPAGISQNLLTPGMVTHSVATDRTVSHVKGFGTTPSVVTRSVATKISHNLFTPGVRVILPDRELMRKPSGDFLGVMGADEESGVFQCPHGNLGTPEPGIDRIQTGCDRVGGNAPHGGQKSCLAAFHGPVQDEQGANIITVVSHIRVKNDVHRRLGRPTRAGPGKWTAGDDREQNKAN